MKHIVILYLILLSSCATNQLKDKLREGIWIEEMSLDSLNNFKSIGRYHKGEPVKRWKYYKNGTLEKKEKYRGDICHTTFYHENGKKQSQGKAKFVLTEKEIHWFYFDKWYFYDENGKLSRISTFENGEIISEQIIE